MFRTVLIALALGALVVFAGGCYYSGYGSYHHYDGGYYGHRRHVRHHVPKYYPRHHVRHHRGYYGHRGHYRGGYGYCR